MDDQETAIPEDSGFSTIDLALLLLALAMPYLLATGHWWRFAIAGAGMVTWIITVRPTWRGLQHFFCVVALLLHTLFWLGVSVVRLL